MMKRYFISVLIGMGAMAVLSGCGGDGTGLPNTTHSNMIIEQENYQQISDDTVTQVLIKNSNQSNFDIIEIYSAPLTSPYEQSFPNNTPPSEIKPGDSRLFQSHNCYNYEVWWKIKIIDDYGNIAEGKYRRQCGFKEILRIKNW